MSSIDEDPQPTGELELKTIALPADTNACGDIFGGWLVSKMDLAASSMAMRAANGRVAAVGIDRMGFMVAIKVGAAVSFYCQEVNRGRSSIEIAVEVWMNSSTSDTLVKVTEGLFIFVAIDDNGRTRPLP